MIHLKSLELPVSILILHYNLELGLLRPGDSADFVLLKDLKNFEVLQTYLQGELVAENGKTKINSVSHLSNPNQFDCSYTRPEDFSFSAGPSDTSVYPYPVIEAYDGQLITGKYNAEIYAKNGFWEADPSRDILKIVVLNRYKKAPIAMAFIKNIGLKSGALASSVAHDSHNIVAVGVSDEALSRAVNAVISEKGGISLAGDGMEKKLGLPVAGLMSTKDGYQVAESYTMLDAEAKQNGLHATLTIYDTFIYGAPRYSPPEAQRSGFIRRRSVSNILTRSFFTG